ncbi:MAG TPA: hypothetical protein PKI19_01340 [Elusimicrobiales bacterium]|nr:hypothetical protein [Elusimicrobiales bacterium]
MERKTGYALLWSGVGIILYSVLTGWRVFSGSVPPPALIDLKSITLPLPSMMNLALPLDPQFSKAANLALHFMFLLLVAAAGNKIGGLGVKLINRQNTDAKKTENRP